MDHIGTSKLSRKEPNAEKEDTLDLRISAFGPAIVVLVCNQIPYAFLLASQIDGSFLLNCRLLFV